MGIGKTNAASGGASLNFDVKAYATESALLAATPKENTIGIITNTVISSWIFAAVEPAEPVEGMVWISTGTSSAVEFNALKKNGLQVYPIAAKQYVDGELVSVTAKSYQSEKWCGWSRHIFKDGDLSEISGFKSVNGTVEITNTIDLVSGLNAYALFYSKETVDVNNCDKIKVTLDGTNYSYVSGDSPLVGVSKNVPTNSAGTIGGVVAHTTILSGVSSGTIPASTYEINVANIEGSVYLVFSCSGTSSRKAELHISEIEFCS